MQANDRLMDTARWLRYAKEDLITAEILLEQSHLPPRQAYWWAQQTIEKALKAILTFGQIDFLNTDDLSTLWSLVPDSWQLKTVQLGIVDLTGRIGDVRYPGDTSEPTKANASEAVKQARAIWTVASTELTQHGFLVENTL